jgi:hypothetical protein
VRGLPTILQMDGWRASVNTINTTTSLSDTQ